MSKKFKVKLNSAGVRELLRSSEMMAICRSHAEGISRNYGSGAKLSEHTGANRVNVSVYKADGDSSNRLLKSMGGKK
jgi:hypothetical protein